MEAQRIGCDDFGGEVQFAPGERREVRSESGARLLLVLAPWPGEGHYRAEERALAD